MRRLLPILAVLLVAASVDAPAGFGMPDFLNMPKAAQTIAPWNRAAPEYRFKSLCADKYGNPYGASENVNLIHEDGIVEGSTLGQDGCFTPQNEPALAVNPLNPNHLVSAANEYRDGVFVYVSLDGGELWRNIALPLENPEQPFFGITDVMGGDPVLAFGPDGTLYYSFIAFSGEYPVSGIGVYVSHDGGITWDPPVLVWGNLEPTIFHDKEWITVDPNTGEVYLTWTRFEFTEFGEYLQSPIVLSVSRDKGKTWTEPAVISDEQHPYNQGSVPQVAADGTLWVAFESASPQNYLRSVVALAEIRTPHLPNPVLHELARVFDDWNCYPFNEDWRATLAGENFRVSSLPAFAIDPVTGGMVIAWADNEGQANCGEIMLELRDVFYRGDKTSSQVKLIRSYNGRDWTEPQRITTGGADKIYPAVAAQDGKIVVSYYTRSYAQDGPLCSYDGSSPRPSVCIDYAARSSTDGFRQEVRLSDQSSNPYTQFGGRFIGDYNSVVLLPGGEAFAVWADSRGDPQATTPNQDIYGARFELPELPELPDGGVPWWLSLGAFGLLPVILVRKPA